MNVVGTNCWCHDDSIYHKNIGTNCLSHGDSIYGVYAVPIVSAMMVQLEIVSVKLDVVEITT